MGEIEKDPYQELFDALTTFGNVLAESIAIERFMDWLAKILNTRQEGG